MDRRTMLCPFVIICLLGLLQTGESLSSSEVQTERVFLRAAMEDSANVVGHKRLIAGAVRLAFHDCVGGCDGCINLANSENNGLGATINQLERYYRQRDVARLMSRADYWILASFAALDVSTCPEGQSDCNIVPQEFKYGREDCDTSPSTSIMHDFPMGHHGHDATIDFFAKEFNMNEKQAVAILGAHTLGHATLRNSGFMGPWVSDENKFDNEYYRTLVSPTHTWRQQRLPSGNFQWNQPGLPPDPSFMLNADMALLKDLNVNGAGRSSCDISSCGDSSSAPLVRQYAADNSVWLADFFEAFQIMIEKTDSSLRTPDANPGQTRPPRPTTSTTAQITQTASPNLDLSGSQVDGERVVLRQAMRDSGNVAGHLRLVAGSVRLAFHDCVGGCDGCINLFNPENGGLGGTINRLNALYTDRNVAELMSRADYWILAAIAALDVAVEEACPQDASCPYLPVSFKIGRADCPTSPDTSAMHTFPDSHAANEETLQFFRNEFSLTDRQTVALLGAHTLGHASLRNSGFMGPWVRNENHLNNEYYRVLNRPRRPWRQVRLPNGNHQWNIPVGLPPDPSFMLNADMSLLEDIHVDENGRSNCTVDTCSQAPTASIVDEYAADNRRWLRDFAGAFQIMIENSPMTLSEVSGQMATSSTTSGSLKLAASLALVALSCVFVRHI